MLQQHHAGDRSGGLLLSRGDDGPRCGLDRRQQLHRVVVPLGRSDDLSYARFYGAPHDDNRGSTDGARSLQRTERCRGSISSRGIGTQARARKKPCKPLRSGRGTSGRRRSRLRAESRENGHSPTRVPRRVVFKGACSRSRAVYCSRAGRARRAWNLRSRRRCARTGRASCAARVHDGSADPAWFQRFARLSKPRS